MNEAPRDDRTTDDLAIKALIKSHGVALTGGVATGKSTVARIIADAGYLVIDADQLARDVVAFGSPGLQQIVHVFGPAVLAADGSLDRQRLGALVFADAERRRQLEALTHPLIRRALGERLVAAGIVARPRWFFYEAALIFETGTAGDFHSVWATVCPRAIQQTRLMTRSGLSAEAAARVIDSQLPASDKAARAAVAIDTSVPPSSVEAKVRELLAALPRP